MDKEYVSNTQHDRNLEKDKDVRNGGMDEGAWEERHQLRERQSWDYGGDIRDKEIIRADKGNFTRDHRNRMVKE